MSVENWARDVPVKVSNRVLPLPVAVTTVTSPAVAVALDELKEADGEGDCGKDAISETW